MGQLLESEEMMTQLKMDISNRYNWESTGAVVFAGEMVGMDYNFNKSFPKTDNTTAVEKYISEQFLELSFQNYLGSLFALKSVHFSFLPDPTPLRWSSEMKNTILKTLIVRITVFVHMPLFVCKTILRYPSLNKDSILAIAPDALCKQLVHQSMENPCRWTLSRRRDGALEIQHRWSAWSDFAKDRRFREHFAAGWADYMQRQLREYDPALFAVGVGGYVVLHEDRIEWIPGVRPSGSCAIM